MAIRVKIKGIPIILAALLPLLAACGEGQSTALLTGTIDQWTPDSHLQLDISADGFDPVPPNEIPVQADGTFSFQQPVDNSVVASIIVTKPGMGSSRIPLYLEKGKTLNVTLRHVHDEQDEHLDIVPTFGGDTRAESEFVNENTSVNPRDFDTFQAFRDSVDRHYADRLTCALAIGNPAFIDDYIVVRDAMSRNARLVNYIPHDADLDTVETAYTDFINSLDFNDPVNEDALLQYLITYGRYYQRKNEGGSYTMPALEELTRRTNNQTMLDNISSRLMFFFLMIDTPYVESVWAKYNTICKDKAQIKRLRPRYESRSKELKKVKRHQ